MPESGEQGVRGWGASQLRQRLDALRRAGIEFVPRPGRERNKPVRTEALGSDVARPRHTAALAQEGSMFEGVLGAEPKLPEAQRRAVLEQIRGEVAACTRCAQLASSRAHTVFGEGSLSPRLMFIGEAPGADEDRTGRPFVGRAGKLLGDMITKGMGLRREDVFIANILKCRPPENRVPLADEVANCRGYLDRQIEALHPEYLCLLGKTAAVSLLGVESTQSMGSLRGRWFSYRGVKTLVTYHPAYLLRQPSGKREAWEDLKMLMNAMGLEIPRREAAPDRHD